MKTGLHAQRGISLTGMIVFGIVAVLLAAGAAKIVPSYVQYRTINGEFAAMVIPPDVKTASDHEIRMAFDKWASVADINAIKSTDIDISKEGGVVTLSASYEVKIPLFGNATLLLEFNPTATSR